MIPIKVVDTDGLSVETFSTLSDNHSARIPHRVARPAEPPVTTTQDTAVSDDAPAQETKE